MSEIFAGESLMLKGKFASRQIKHGGLNHYVSKTQLKMPTFSFSFGVILRPFLGYLATYACRR